MLKTLRDKKFLSHLLLFILFNSGLYLFLFSFHHIFPLDRADYFQSAHHYLPDPRVTGQPFRLFSALAQYDSQWYLKIAASGYTFAPDTPHSLSAKNMDTGLTYNFFPLFPLIIRLFLFVIPNLEVAAFVTSVFLLLISFASLYLFVSDFFSGIIARKTVWLLFLFPFSVFYRSYYTESLFLTLSVWFLFFLLKKNFLLSGIFLALLNITKGRAFPLNLLFLISLLIDLKHRRINLRTFFLSLTLALIPLAAWCLYNYQTTGDFFFFSRLIDVWKPHPAWMSLLYNFIGILKFVYLPFLTFHYSQVEIATFFICLFLLYRSRTFLPRELWWFSLLTCIFPLLTVDFTSYSRFQSVSFPLFLYIAAAAPRRLYICLILLFLPLFFLTSLFFINWYWVG